MGFFDFLAQFFPAPYKQGKQTYQRVVQQTQIPATQVTPSNVTRPVMQQPPPAATIAPTKYRWVIQGVIRRGR